MADRSHDEDDDDFELELEPVDPEILAMEQRRAQQKTDEAAAKVDIEEIIRQKVGDKYGYGDYDVSWNWLRQFRFTTRHVLILTAVLAFGMALFKGLGGCSGLFVAGVIAIGVGWFAVMRHERKLEAERQRMREEFAATRTISGLDSGASAPVGVPQSRFAVKFSYSMQELMIAMTIAAVVFGLVYSFGPEAVTLTLGVIALAGLAVQAMGFDPPRIVVLGWWLLLVIYLAAGLITALASSS